MNKIYFFLFMLMLMHSCSDPYKDEAEKALEYAGDNQAEIKKVLIHFQDDNDPLKRQAAWFLVANMLYHVGYEGRDVEAYDSAYIRMSQECPEYRDSIFNAIVSRLGVDYFDEHADILTMKADYLIKAIDDACNTWRNSAWCKDYDDTYFFNYVLPYRILDEPLSDWRNHLNTAIPYLKMPILLSNRGVEVEAETASFQSCKLIDATSASNGVMALLSANEDSITFLLDAPLASWKNIIFRYTTQEKEARCKITLNGKEISTLLLEPCKNTGVFRETRIGFDAHLKKGKNKLTIKYCNGVFGLDKICIRNIEAFTDKENIDFSKSYFRISNKATREFVVFDTLRASLLNQIELKPLSMKDSTMLLRLNYLGYPCWNICSYKKDSTNLCMEAQYCQTDTGSVMAQYHYIGGNHQKWVIIPVGDERDVFRIMNKNSGLFLEARKNVVTNKDSLVQMPYRASDTQHWKIERAGKNPIPEVFFQIGSAISSALRVMDVMCQFEFLNYSGTIPPKATSLINGRTGKCRDEADFVVYLCRYLGIPSTVDFTPHWGNRSLSHSWSVLIKPNGTGTPFYMGCAPGDTVQYFHSYLKPKVFRHRFALNKQIVQDLAGEKSTPSLFDSPCFTDVTDEYYETTDVIRYIPLNDSIHKVAYICVFDNRNWIPVYYGNIRDGKVRFSSMGRRIMYMAAFYEEGQIIPFGVPFYISSTGKVCDVCVKKDKKQTMHLLRKYPFMGKEDFFNLRMDRGRFEGSNNKDFSDATVFHVHSGATNGNWYDIPVTDDNMYRYLRYIGANGSRCNINELEFYNEKNIKLQGKIIGTEGESWCPKERVFDGDILTGFGGNTPDGHWVGLQLNNPSRITRIRYIGRNDGNGIEKGDKYELYYWNEGKWDLLVSEVAKQNELCFYNMPVGGLYVLRNMTKGHEERIFTYKNGNQIWW